MPTESVEWIFSFFGYVLVPGCVLVSVIANSVVLYDLLRKPQRTKMDLFPLNMATADIVASVGDCARLHFSVWFERHRLVDFSASFIFNTSRLMSNMSALGTLILMYAAIMYPFYIRRLRKMHVRSMIAFNWTFAATHQLYLVLLTVCYFRWYYAAHLPSFLASYEKKGSMIIFTKITNERNSLLHFLLFVLQNFSYVTNPFLYYRGRQESLLQKAKELVTAIFVRPAPPVANNVADSGAPLTGEQQPSTDATQSTLEVRHSGSGGRGELPS
ncbi:hypothetical protein M3Y99_00899600 [Aphelenchoides fujianensis]|nr:hypothetical protein M3Y99_00899600 [Aphelenchoides fujianensis]